MLRMVSVKPPDVIPGTAQVTVFLLNGGPVTVTAQPIYFYSGRTGAPSADVLQPVPGQPGQYKGIVWLMTDGSSSILLHISGTLGSGELVAPVMAVSTAQKRLPAGTVYILIGLGVLLFFARHRAFYAALPILLLWCCSKWISMWLNLPSRAHHHETSDKDELFLSSAALRTWLGRLGYNHFPQASQMTIPKDHQFSQALLQHHIDHARSLEDTLA